MAQICRKEGYEELLVQPMRNRERVRGEEGEREGDRALLLQFQTQNLCKYHFL